MSSMDRRTLLKFVASIPLAVWLERDAFAATRPLVRYNVRNSRGQAMLKIYAQGVAKMKALAESDPRGWTFQWYTHAVRDDRTKAAELSRIYPVPGPEQALANAVWETCQAHFDPTNEPFFLPWHRMYVLWLERIIRYLTKEPKFTLPYWNYSAPGPTHGILPAAFRKSIILSPLFSPLFVPNRNPGVNSGQPIDAPRRGRGSLETTALSECSYDPQGAVQGFCQALDFGLHGNVHVLIGDEENMGSVPWAARDPIFWMHHCNIDRLWASWNKGGRSNPNSAAFLNATFTFADENGQKVVGTVKDVLSTQALGYVYDAYDQVPPCPRPLRALAESVQKATRVLVADAPVPLASEPVRIQLKMPEAPAPVAPESTFDKQISRLSPSARAYLVISKLRAAAQPNVVYDLYFAPPDHASGKPSARHRVGMINFFNAVRHGEHAQALANDERFFSFDITNLTRRLQSEGRLEAEPLVFIVPAGEPATNAAPVIGSIELVLQ